MSFYRYIFRFFLCILSSRFLSLPQVDLARATFPHERVLEPASLLHSNPKRLYTVVGRYNDRFLPRYDIPWHSRIATWQTCQMCPARWRRSRSAVNAKHPGSLHERAMGGQRWSSSGPATSLRKLLATTFMWSGHRFGRTRIGAPKAEPQQLLAEKRLHKLLYASRCLA